MVNAPAAMMTYWYSLAYPTPLVLQRNPRENPAGFPDKMQSDVLHPPDRSLLQCPHVLYHWWVAGEAKAAEQSSCKVCGF